MSNCDEDIGASDGTDEVARSRTVLGADGAERDEVTVGRSANPDPDRGAPKERIKFDKPGRWGAVEPSPLTPLGVSTTDSILEGPVLRLVNFCTPPTPLALDVADEDGGDPIKLIVPV